MFSKKINLVLAVLVASLLIFQPFSVATSDYIWSDDSVMASTTESVDLKLESGAAILIDQKSGEVLYEYNAHEQLRPASVTKVMTILLIMEALDSGRLSLEDKIPCSENAAAMGGSQIWLDVREELTVNEMLKAICVVSANDCTMAMAEYLAGNESAFVEQMNAKAKSLGMNDTCFKNCHGIDEDGHVTSAYDISLMSRELLNNHPSITNYTTIWMDSLRDGKSSLVNTNKLLRTYNGATGLKTGSTSLALYNLSASATRNNLGLIAVVMKAPTSKDRFSCASSLLDYGFANFELKTLTTKSENIKSISVSKGILPSVNAVSESECVVLIPKGKDFNIEQNITINQNLSAPISKGQIIGNIQYFIDGNCISETNLISDNFVDKINIISMEKNILYNWFSILRF